MPTVAWTSASLLYAGATRVYVRQYWADEWELIANLEPLEMRWALYPDIPTAQLRFDYGRYIARNGNTVQTIAKVNWLGWYVRIEADCEDGTLLWVGFIDEATDNQGGLVPVSSNPADGNIPTGRIDLVAYAMPAALKHERILTSQWWDGSGKRTSGCGLTFNKTKNRTPTKPSGQPTHLFYAGDDGVEWTSQDVVDYLLEHHCPRKPDGSNGIPFALVGGTLLPDWPLGELASDGQTVWALLERLIERRNFVTASYLYDETENEVQFKLHSMSHITADLGDGKTLVANDSLLDVILDLDQSTTATVTRSATQQYHQVVVRGAKRSSIVTLRCDSQGLLKDWTTDEETAWLTGASDHPDYDTWDEKEKRIENDRVRDGLRNVFSRFKLYSDDWLLNGGIGNVFRRDDGFKHYSFPPEFEIITSLPIDPDGDYSGDNIETEDPAATINSGLTADPIFCHKDFLHENLLTLPYFNVQVEQPEPQKLSFISSGVSQLHFDSAAIYLQNDIVEYDRVNYRSFRATVSVQEDRYAEGVVPETVSGTLDQVRRIVIYTPGTERCDYMCPQTIVQLNEAGTAGTVSLGGLVNDNRDRLRWQAELHALWYLIPRAILTIQSARPSATPAVGQLLTTLNATREHAATINTIVSEITLRIPLTENGEPGAPQYTLKTADYSDLQLPF
jgi:hypothetical protein